MFTTSFDGCHAAIVVGRVAQSLVKIMMMMNRWAEKSREEFFRAGPLLARKGFFFNGET
jgi:hypothetical protein